MISIVGFVLLISSHLAFGGPCDNVVSMPAIWSGGYSAALTVQIQKTTTSWAVDITFLTPVSYVDVNDAIFFTADFTTFRLSNKSYNGVLPAGTNQTLTFNVVYPSNNTLVPIIISAVFNGVNLCTGPPVVTTKPTTATTKPTTATTKPTTATTKPTTATTKPTTATTKPTTATTKPTTTITTTTKPTTPVYGGYCSNVSITNSWPGSYTANLTLHIAKTTNNWAIDIIFTAAISSLDVWDAKSSTTDFITFRLTNLPNNGVLPAGSTQSLIFNVLYPSSNVMPKFVNIYFNGVGLCAAAGVPV